MERNCWYCHKPLPLTKLFKKDLFCSHAHEEQYFADQNAAAFARMKELEPEVKADLDAVEPVAVAPPVPAPAAVPRTAPPQAALPKSPPPLPPPVASIPEAPPPPMAPHLKTDLFLAESQPPDFVPEGPLLPVPSPAPPCRELSAVELELQAASLIDPRLSARPLMTRPAGGFEELAFGVTARDIPRDLEPQASRSDMRPQRRAEPVPVWNGGAESDSSAISIVALESSLAAELSPRISTVEAQLHGTLRAESTPAWNGGAASDQRISVLAPESSLAPELSLRISTVEAAPHGTLRGTLRAESVPVWTGNAASDSGISAIGLESSLFAPPLMRIARVENRLHGKLPSANCTAVPRIEPLEGSMQVEFVSSPSFSNRNQFPVAEMPAPDAGELAPQGTVAQEWTARPDVRCDQVFPANFDQPAVEFSKGQHVPETELSRTLPGALANGDWKISRPAELQRPANLASSWTNSHNPAIAARSTVHAGEGQPVAPHLAAANPREISTDAVSPCVIDWPAAAADFKSAGAIRILETSHDLTAPVLAEESTHVLLSMTARRVKDPLLAPHAALETVRNATIRPVSFAPVPEVAVATAENLGRALAESSVPKLSPAGGFEQASASLATEQHILRHLSATPLAAARIDAPFLPVREETLLNSISAADHQTANHCRTPENNTSRPADPAIRARTPSVEILNWCHNSETESRVAPQPAIPIHAASLVVPPGLAARIAPGWKRQAPSTGHFELVAKSNAGTVAFQAVLRTPPTPAYSSSSLPAWAMADVSHVPASSVPPPAACFPHDLTLRDVAYARGGRAQKSRL